MNKKVNRRRPIQIKFQATQQETDVINAVKTQLNLTLTELMLKGIEALERETNKEAN